MSSRAYATLLVIMWVAFVACVWWAFTHLNAFIGAPLVVTIFVLTWAINDSIAMKME